MTAEIHIAITDEGRRAIERMAQAPRKLAAALSDALQRTLVAMENHLKADLLSGSYSPGRTVGGSTPVGIRSGALRQSVTHQVDRSLSGWVGTAGGPASAYARVILGDGTTTITPKRAKHLWIPVASNVGPSGQMRMSPREAFEQTGPKGGKLLSIFRSKSGNLVAFLRAGGKYKRATKAGRRRGDLKGRLLFVLKYEVRVKGTDALAQAVRDKRRLLTDNLNAALRSATGDS